MKWKFAGRFFSSLDDAVDAAAAAADAADADERMNEMLARHPERILGRARFHQLLLADQCDVGACERLGLLIDCVITGLTELCDCGRMLGEHSKFTEACPEVPGYFLSKRLADSLNGFPDYHTGVAYRQGQ